MSLEVLIFDVDGTLADTEETHREAFNRAFECLGLPWQWSREHYAELLKTTGGKERIGAHLASLELPAEERAALTAFIPTIHRTKTELYTRWVSQGEVPLRDGVRRLLAEARAHGLRLAIASTTTRENVDALLGATLGGESIGWFDAIATGDEAERKKPASDIYYIVMRALDVHPKSCVAFEDSGRGLAAAKGAGIVTVVTPTYWTRHDHFAGADLMLPTLGDVDHPLPAADAERIGYTMLGVLELQRLHALRARGAARTLPGQPSPAPRKPFSKS